MKDEKEKIFEELKEDLNNIKIKRDPNVLNNKSNQPFWDLEDKYKKKLNNLTKKK